MAAGNLSGFNLDVAFQIAANQQNGLIDKNSRTSVQSDQLHGHDTGSRKEGKKPL
jgi:hypothetical protein